MWAEKRQPIAGFACSAGRRRTASRFVRVALGRKPTSFQAGESTSAKPVTISSASPAERFWPRVSLPFVDLLGAIALLVNAAKGLSALQLSRCIDVSYKTAFVLAHKLREALAVETGEILLDATVEIDGAYFGGHVRPANARSDRVDRRLRTHRRAERRSVIALRQRNGMTLTGVFEQESDGLAFARSRIKPNTRIVADETPHWDLLPGTFDIERVNHSDAYSFLDGVHINGAESYFARLRRMIRGRLFAR